jgi:hypothetical protein
MCCKYCQSAVFCIKAHGLISIKYQSGVFVVVLKNTINEDTKKIFCKKCGADIFLPPPYDFLQLKNKGEQKWN